MRVREKYSPYGIKKEPGHTGYIRQRRLTGICETCNQDMKNHDTCEACDILCGSNHERSADNYLGHNLCWSCGEKWEKMMVRKGCAISFEDFKGHEVLGRPRKDGK